MITERSNNANDEFYLHKDHQGSTTSITNASGSLVQQFIYDPWGKQYNVHSNSIFSAYSSPGISRGYTGHKMINDMDIIHMNGRTYDPTLGRFLQADPFVQVPMNSQSYNRYSYVLNNPLSMTDPSGFFFKSLLRKIASIPILNAVVTVVLAVYCQACLVAYSAMSTYAVTGSLKSAFTAGIAAAIMPGGGSVGNVVASAVIGGISSKLQGGKFGHGFWAAGIGAAMGGATRGIKSAIGKTLVATAVGGTISKITGGKFANGAYSAAFAAALSAGLNSGKVNAKDAAYAELSESIYDDGNGAQVGDTVAGYELKEIIAEENGLRAGLFVDQGGNNVVAFAGTDTSSFSGFLTDMKANLLQGLGLDSAQYSSAIGLAGRMNTRFGGNVHFTGHSLGGGLASAAAIVTGGSATVFNAAGIRNSTIGSFSRNNGSITHYYSGYDGIRAINAFSGASVPGTQINLGHAGPHTMPNVCAAMGTSC